MELNQYQQQYFDLIQGFFEDDVVPYEICLFVGIVLGRGTSERHSCFVLCSICSDDSFTVCDSRDKKLKLWNTETGEEVKTF